MAAVSLPLWPADGGVDARSRRRFRFNPVFLVSDPEQKWRLLANFLLYLTPFLAAAFFLGTVFIKAREAFPRVYFADLTGSGIAGLLVLGAMYVFAPEEIVTVPLVLWALGGVLWFVGTGSRAGPAALITARCRLARRVPGPARGDRQSFDRGLALQGHRLRPELPRCARASTGVSRPSATSRSIPRPICISRRASPTTRAFNLPDLPANTYVGMYIDGDGPDRAIMRTLGEAERDYFLYPADVLPLRRQGQAEHLRRPVRRRHLDHAALGAGAPAVTVAAVQSRRSSPPSTTTVAARLHRRCCSGPARHGHRL